jgi:hypothetical protein
VAVQAHSGAAAAERIPRDVQTVAAGSERVGASTNEIAQDTAEATHVAGTAVEVTGATPLPPAIGAVDACQRDVVIYRHRSRTQPGSGKPAAVTSRVGHRRSREGVP